MSALFDTLTAVVDWDRASAASHHFALGEYLRESVADIAVQLEAAGLRLVAVPDAKNPTPALIEAAYIAQDDLSTVPTWAIRAAADVIEAYIDAQNHTRVHVLGHPQEPTR